MILNHQIQEGEKETQEALHHKQMKKLKKEGNPIHQIPQENPV